MRDNADLGGPGVASRILENCSAEHRAAFTSDKGIDIEKLISLLAASSVDKYHQLAEEIRRLYFQEICRSLAQAQVLNTQKLTLGLLKLHEIQSFKQYELLTGVLTTNHDGLLQLAAQQVYGGAHLGIPFGGTTVVDASGSATPPILHLHGSFTWRFGVPLVVTPLTATTTYHVDTVWIPPAILKDPKSYPFNKLAGMAYELLARDCDVLRVVGCSLTQNDWNILSMIFNAQRHRTIVTGAPFRVELIMLPSTCDEIMDTCSYLQSLVHVKHLTDGDGFLDYAEESSITDEMKNVLAFWMKQKINFHQKAGHLGSTLEATLAEIAGAP